MVKTATGVTEDGTSSEAEGSSTVSTGIYQELSAQVKVHVTAVKQVTFREDRSAAGKIKKGCRTCMLELSEIRPHAQGLSRTTYLAEQGS